MKKNVILVQIIARKLDMIVLKEKLFAPVVKLDMSLTLKITNVKAVTKLMEQWKVVQVLYITH